MNILGFRILISTPSTNSYLHIVIWGLKLKIKTDFRLILKRVCFFPYVYRNGKTRVFLFEQPRRGCLAISSAFAALCNFTYRRPNKARTKFEIYQIYYLHGLYFSIYKFDSQLSISNIPKLFFISILIDNAL